MPVKEGREYRSFTGLFHAVEDSQDESAYTVEGYATTFDEPYDFVRGVKEQILSSALDGADMSDVIFQLNHEGQTLARQRNGSLSLERDSHGLKCRAYLGGSQAGRDLYEAISNGLIDKMSWGFMVADDGWDWDEATRTSSITRITKVYDVSAVSIPANEFTEIHARSYLDGVIEAERQELSQRSKEQEERERLAVYLSAIELGD